ncbi:MAG: hypothetical protein ABH879_07220 [archaeon]
MKRFTATENESDYQRDLSALFTIARNIADKHSVSFSDILGSIRQAESLADGPAIPIGVFLPGLGILQSVTKYLKEESGLSYHEIAVLLNRDDRVVWATYNSAVRRRRGRAGAVNRDVCIPASVFADRSVSAFAALCRYLRDSCGAGTAEIAGLIRRDNKAVWAALRRIGNAG